MNVVKLEHVTVVRGDRPILRDLSTHIPTNAITALVGLNGSGKTTLLRTLLGELPYTGTIRWANDRPVLGYVPQKLALESAQPVRVLELFGLAWQRRPVFLGVSREVRKRAEATLERLGAAHLRDRPVTGLSGGELQRVLLGLALHPSPDLLLLDEPAAGIDFADQEPFHELIAGLRKELNTTLLLVSHDLSLVNRHADHVLCLRDGRIECEGAPERLLTPEAIGRIFGPDARLTVHSH